MDRLTDFEHEKIGLDSGLRIADSRQHYKKGQRYASNHDKHVMTAKKASR